MNRTIDPDLKAELAANNGRYVFLVKISLRSKTEYVWSGAGPLVWDAQTYKGVGKLGNIGEIVEDTVVRSAGTKLSLSGVDPDLLSEALYDVQIGAPARIYIAAVDEEMALVGVPQLIFRGFVDKPPVVLDPENPTIEIYLETRMVNHARASNRRLTAADQNANGYPDDSGMDGVEPLADQGLKWGLA